MRCSDQGGVSLSHDQYYGLSGLDVPFPFRPHDELIQGKALDCVDSAGHQPNLQASSHLPLRSTSNSPLSWAPARPLQRALFVLLISMCPRSKKEPQLGGLPGWAHPWPLHLHLHEVHHQVATVLNPIRQSLPCCSSEPLAQHV